MANITLSIDDQLLDRGRDYARTRGTSLNALVQKLLSATISTPDASVDFMIERLRQNADNSMGIKFSREELHRY